MDTKIVDGITYYLVRRADASLADFAYIWRSGDNQHTLEPTYEENEAAVDRAQRGKSFGDR